MVPRDKERGRKEGRGAGRRGRGRKGREVLTHDACDALDLSRDSRLLRASRDDVLENCNRITVGGDGEGHVRLCQVEFDSALCTL